MLKFKKVYVVSSYKVNSTSSDFTIDLPETVQLEYVKYTRSTFLILGIQ